MTPQGRPATWAEYHRRLAGIAAEMIGARQCFIVDPEYAADEVRARAFDTYAERMAQVPLPAESGEGNTPENQPFRPERGAE